MKNIKNAQGIPKLLGKYSGHIITDDVPIIELTEHIMEEKLSLLLLDLYFHGNIEFYSGQYNNKFACKYFDNDEKILYRSFELTKVSNCILKLCHPFDCSCNTYRASNNLLKEKSLFSLLQNNSYYKGTLATANFFKIENYAYGPFKLGRNHLRQIPFEKEGTMPINHDQNLSHEMFLQRLLRDYFKHRFPYAYDQPPRDWENASENGVNMIFDFTDSYGNITMKQVKIYGILSNNRFIKFYLPLTQWYCKDTHSKMIVSTGLPDKQPLLNLHLIRNAEEVIICPTLEEAYNLQATSNTEGVVFTAFVCDACQYHQVDFSPVAQKPVTLLISNSNGMSLAESYLKVSTLYEYLRNEIQITNIKFIQREIVYPSVAGITDINGLMAVYRKERPKIIMDSPIELTEANFMGMLDKAKAEIERKALQSQNFPFWRPAQSVTDTNASEEPKEQKNLYEQFLLRPFFLRRTVNYIIGERGIGKSCFITALCGHILGSSAPFLEERCWTRRISGKSLKIVHLVFDTDGIFGIQKHQDDFKDYLTVKEGKYLVENLHDDGINYSEERNYFHLIDRINGLKSKIGNPEQDIDILVIDTLLALGEDTDRGYLVVQKLNKDYPNALIFVLHHLNKNKEQYGSEKKLAGANAVFELFRTREQLQALEGRSPTLHDPFTLKFTKTRFNTIPEDGESFAVRVDDKGHFIVDTPVRSQAEMRKLVIAGYERNNIPQKQIAQLFNVSDRSLRTWKNDENA